ncbi:hypothetical protein [Saccharothrix sp. ST-888]|uniref:hypothetical protein n=1 Tax=Saccharothrix sp. ST-888 TaxID=1427391 RepID=UPI00069911AA|nr:hypothetical protein [Saccharothrix sp. ST-888]
MHTEQLLDGWAAQLLTLDAAEGRPVTVEKTVAVYTSRDPATASPLQTARLLAAQAPDFDRLLDEHALRWAELWRRCHIDADFDGIGAVHLNLFHLLQTYSEHSVDLDVGIPARGLHGEAYRGHVFWDELFVLRLLNLRFPEVGAARPTRLIGRGRPRAVRASLPGSGHDRGGVHRLMPSENRRWPDDHDRIVLRCGEHREAR